MKKIEDIDEKYIDIIKRAQLYRECREYLIMGVGFRELKEDAPEEIKRKYKEFLKYDQAICDYQELSGEELQ